MSSAESPEALEAFLLELNDAAARVILPLFRAEHGLENKDEAGGFDPVTTADRGAEAAIRQLLQERFPKHGVVGEEYGADRPEAEFVWVLDPIDGTRAFIAGLPVWTTLIGLRRQGRPLVGSIGQPVLGEVFLGGPSGAWLVTGAGRAPLATRKGLPLARAIVSTTDPFPGFSPAETAAWERVRRAARLARLGCDAYAYAMVAAGHMDVVVEAGLKAWDIDAAIPVIEGAGGALCEWSGQPLGSAGGRVAMAGDRALLDEVVTALAWG